MKKLYAELNLEKLQELLNGSDIIALEFLNNTKASEYYVRTKFIQDNGFEWTSIVPYKYRRTGLELNTEEAIANYLKSVKKYFTKDWMNNWGKKEKEECENDIKAKKKQNEDKLSRGKKATAIVTPYVLLSLLSLKECNNSTELPANRNLQRRLQDLKDRGYTISIVQYGMEKTTSTLLPFPRYNEMGYETFTKQFKARVIRLLKQRNAFETGHRFQDPYKLKEPQQQIMFDLFGEPEPTVNQESIRQLRRRINGHDIEVFRCYSDCLYASYGTKWNGNAAAFNGSLFVSQDGRLRRLTPVECERLMGFPDNYTAIANPRLTNRYQATGNSWVVPVIKWIMNRLLLFVNGGNNAIQSINLPVPCVVKDDFELFLLDDFTPVGCQYLNASNSCNDFVLSNMLDIIDTDPDEKLYISRAGCEGILRRKHEQNAKMNIRLESVLEDCVTPIVSA